MAVQPSASIPGADLYSMGPYMDPSLPVYKPAIARGLLSDSKAEDMMGNFAGGLLAGYQVRPAQGDLMQYGMQPHGAWQPQGGLLSSHGMSPASQAHPQAPMPTQVMPVNPSGVYQGQPNPSASTGGGGFGGMTNRDMLEMLYADQLAAGRGENGAHAIHSLLGTGEGLTLNGQPYSLAGKYGIELDAAFDPEAVARAQYFANTGKSPLAFKDGYNPNTRMPMPTKREPK